jgi:hypothetical protein
MKIPCKRAVIVIAEAKTKPVILIVVIMPSSFMSVKKEATQGI